MVRSASSPSPSAKRGKAPGAMHAILKCSTPEKIIGIAPRRPLQSQPLPHPSGGRGAVARVPAPGDIMVRPALILRFSAFLVVAVGLTAWDQLPAGSGQQPEPKTTTIADGTLPDAWVKTLAWRCVGPANMAGRITAISVYEADPSMYWVATASGGLLKTTNNGTTFEHQFDKEATVSIGDVCVAQSNPNIVWVGTGENNPRNSVSYGDGIYKSTDGGKTWKNMGLKATFQIGRIAVHPKNPDVVYVGALGRLYGPNPERGLFKTTDGGKTWERLLHVDDHTGVTDVAMNPKEPDTLVVAPGE